MLAQFACIGFSGNKASNTSSDEQRNDNPHFIHLAELKVEQQKTMKLENENVIKRHAFALQCQ